MGDDQGRGSSAISGERRVRIPVDVLRAAGLEVGDHVVLRADGAGRVVLERQADVVAEFAGMLTGTYRPDELDDLRSEWD